MVGRRLIRLPCLPLSPLHSWLSPIFLLFIPGSRKHCGRTPSPSHTLTSFASQHTVRLFVQIFQAPWENVWANILGVKTTFLQPFFFWRMVSPEGHLCPLGQSFVYLRTWASPFKTRWAQEAAAQSHHHSFLSLQVEQTKNRSTAKFTFGMWLNRWALLSFLLQVELRGADETWALTGFSLLFSFSGKGKACLQSHCLISSHRMYYRNC